MSLLVYDDYREPVKGTSQQWVKASGNRTPLTETVSPTQNQIWNSTVLHEVFEKVL